MACRWASRGAFRDSGKTVRRSLSPFWGALKNRYIDAAHPLPGALASPGGYGLTPGYIAGCVHSTGDGSL